MKAASELSDSKEAVLLVLILLAFSKRRNFQMEVEEEKDLEAEEMDYRETLDRKKAERLSMDK